MNFLRRAASVRSAVLLAALACCSCGGRPNVYPVTGKVFFEGQPATGALVAFHPVGDSEQNVLPHAVVAADGTFQLTTFRKHDGAPPGRYQVTVVWRVRRVGAEPGDDDDGFVLTPRYLRPTQSGLLAEVKQEPTALEPFQLKK
jgi:hypothetical protein